MEKVAVLAAVALFAGALALAVRAVRRSIARDKALDAAAVQEYGADRDPQPASASADGVGKLEVKWDRFWHIREIAFRRSALPGRLADAEAIRPWARDHAMRTAAMFAGWEHDKRTELDGWLAGHLRTLGFASLDEVVAEQERALAETIERMERDVERTDIECTETGSWTDRDVALLREYEAAHPLRRDEVRA